MPKRFTLRKVKQHSYSRQGYVLKDLGYVFAIYDREWKKRVNGCGFGVGRDFSEFKYIETAHSREVAQFWVDWLNANRAESYSHRIMIPMDAWNEGLKLYK